MKNHVLALAIFIGILFSCSSDKKSSSSPSILRTNSISSVTSFTALCSSTIASDGGSMITARGVVWNTTPNPTIALPTKTNDGAGIGTFTSVITGLVGNTVYYVRSFASTLEGTTYGDQQQFTTSSESLLPVISTDVVNITTLSTAQSTCTITSDNGTNIIARGVVWSTGNNPTVDLSTKTNDGAGIGTFSSNIIGLSPNTTYNIRAYATNNVGTAYGVQKQFITSSDLMNDIAIGNQIWMYKNLDVTTYRNGDPIPQEIFWQVLPAVSQWFSLTTGAWVTYQDASLNDKIYGKLYNWYAVNDPRGLAPVGYHIPSLAEWTTLINFLGGPYQAGHKMKSVSQWTIEYAQMLPNLNSSGFTGLPGGYLGNNGGYQDILIGGYWWSSTLNNNGNPYIVSLLNSSNNCQTGTTIKNNGISVRCIKD
ncbi:MAG: fibrobacter succinogenes major paralogous domain-containing protein [Flavobacterium sp.]|nr:fibrobacter succinogenes major paralogous domain-containing protein [Flavobacterium sp.]